MSDNKKNTSEPSEQEASSGKGPKKIGQILENGLEDYARQSLSALAQRDYDLGKFLFTVSTFAILISFTLITALGKEYTFVLLSFIPFIMSIRTALNLVVEGVGELKFTELIIDDYDRMKGYIRKRKNKWFCEFTVGAVIFTIAFAFIAIDKSTGSKVLSLMGFQSAGHELVQPLTDINNSLREIHNWIQNISVLPSEGSAVCRISEEEVRNLIMKNHEEIIGLIVSHDQHLKSLAEIDSLHHDRHLKIITSKINSHCNYSAQQAH